MACIIRSLEEQALLLHITKLCKTPTVICIRRFLKLLLELIISKVLSRLIFRVNILALLQLPISLLVYIFTRVSSTINIQIVIDAVVVITYLLNTCIGLPMLLHLSFLRSSELSFLSNTRLVFQGSSNRRILEVKIQFQVEVANYHINQMFSIISSPPEFLAI